MRLSILAAVIASALAGAGEAPVPQTFGSARYVEPAGWQAEKSDSSLRFSRGVDVIKARWFGGKGSRYAAAGDYLVGFEATTMGKTPEKARLAKVAGRKVWVYRHGYPIDLGDPHAASPGPVQLASEEFCILPMGTRFLVLSWAHESPVPDPEAAGEKAWEAFLSSLRLSK